MIYVYQTEKKNRCFDPLKYNGGKMCGDNIKMI